MYKNCFEVFHSVPSHIIKPFNYTSKMHNDYSLHIFILFLINVPFTILTRPFVQLKSV
jgi:hypothetical protein